MADQLGLRRSWFQRAASYPHYDVTIETRERALELGAQQGSRRQIIKCAHQLKMELQAQNKNALEQMSLF